MSKLVPTYGISDVMLKKICRQMNIPTPPRGYWAKVQNNIRVEKVKLPKLKIGQPTTYWIQKRDQVSPNAETEDEKLSEEAIQILGNINEGISGPSREGHAFWMRWAKAHADRLDPLTNGLPFENETE